MPANDLSQVYEALKNADASGDTAAAQKLADYLKSQASTPAEKTPEQPKGNALTGGLEAGANVATGAIATPVAGIAGLLTGGNADTVKQWQEDLTYEPKTKAGQDITRAVTYPFRKLGEAADAVGRKVTDITHSPALGAAANTAIQSIPAIVGKGLGRLAAGSETSATISTAAAAARARTYVTKSVGLDWDKLPAALQKTLTDIGKDATALDKLNPEAVKRQARLEALKLPATKGQINRDLGQLTTEENLTKSKSGEPIRAVNAAQDERLHGLLDELRTATGAVADTRTKVGTSGQGALRAKYREAKARAGEAYSLANKLGEGEITTVKPLEDFLKDPINDANVGTDIRARLKAYSSEDGQISLKHLEDIRQELTRNAKNPNKGGHYAGQAAKVIDQIMDEAGSSAYKNARASWKSMKDEFDKQGRVKKLVSEKGMSSDRATALEDTLDHVLKSPAEDIGKIKKSLLDKSSSTKVRKQGQQAWRDIQGGVIEHLREKATGRRKIPGETGVDQFNSSFLDAFNELEADGKIDAVFDKPIANRLRLIAQGVRDVRTKPSGRIAGSDTVPRALNMVEKLLDTKLGGAIGVVKKVTEVVSDKEGRQARAATKSPLEEPAKAGKKSQKRQHTLNDLKNYAPVAVAAPRVGDQQ